MRTRAPSWVLARPESSGRGEGETERPGCGPIPSDQGSVRRAVGRYSERVTLTSRVTRIDARTGPLLYRHIAT